MTRLARGAATATLCCMTAIGCARPQAPEGGPVPEIYLTVIETRPENMAVVDPFDGPVRVRFARTVSERLLGGPLAGSVVVSPPTGEVEVSLDGDALEISLAGGFEAGRIYRVTVRPAFQDRFQNAMPGPLDIFFSTGPEFQPTLVAGLVSDRLTLDVAEDARVEALSMEGVGAEGVPEVAQVAVSDSSGFFSISYLPPGPYTLRAYDDSNRDGSPGGSEAWDSLSVTVSPGDTLVVTELALLAPDTTAAVLGEVEVVDSLTLRATFDDYFAPDVDLGGAETTVITRDTGGGLGVVELLHESQWDPAPPPDAPVDPDAPDAPAAPGPGAQDAATAPSLPSRDLIIVLEDPLPADLVLDVEIQGVTNINGLPGGGGTAEVSRDSPPDP